MSDCLIIGGGVSGLLTALQLHEAGLKVTLIERGKIGQESSWAGGGIISPLYPWRFSAPVTAGAWSAHLLNSVGTPLAVKPVRGQMILFVTPPNLVSRIVLAKDRYVIPRRDGSVLVGSTVEQTGFDKSTTDTAREDLKSAAFKLIPRLADYTVQKHWAGLRPSSPNGVPYIGKHPNIEGLYINTGHFRNGIVLGLASARLLADIVLERVPILEPSDYALTAERGKNATIEQCRNEP